MTSIPFHPLGQTEPCECPICQRDWSRERRFDEDAIHEAAHCCLWKYIGHAERVSIAERVERGMSWEDAINGGTR